MLSAAFYNAIRPMFGGKLTQGQVDGCARIVAYGQEHGYSRSQVAYALATAKHETADWMLPIREGARRYGAAYTDAQAQRAVASIHAKGIIKTNYALPTGPYKKSYYGRGLIQITWIENYARLGDRIGVDLVADPDKALTWEVALPLLFIGMAEGLYTGKTLPRAGSGKAGDEFDVALRAVVNGDTKSVEPVVDGYAETFFTALEADFAEAAAPAVVPEPADISIEFTNMPAGFHVTCVQEGGKYVCTFQANQ